MKIGISGANGYIGKNLIPYLISLNHEVCIYSRKPPQYKFEKLKWFNFDLNSISPLSINENIDVFIHLASNTNGYSQKIIDREIQSTKNLIFEVNQVKAKFIFISSQTSSNDAPTYYGQLKWVIEKIVLDNGGVVIRFGQVFGGDPGGLYLRLIQLTSKSNFIPHFSNMVNIQLISIENILRLLDSVINQKINDAVIAIGSIRPIQFNYYMNYLSLINSSSLKFLISFPEILFRLIYPIVKKNSQAQKVYSLLNLNSMDISSSLKSMEFININFPTKLLKIRVYKRMNIYEAIVIYKYLFSEMPTMAIIKKYLEILKISGTTRPVTKCRAYLLSPFLIKLIIGGGLNSDCELLRKRIKIMFSITEASIFGSSRVAGINQSFRFGGVVLAAVSLVYNELLFRVIGRILPNSVRRMFR